MAFAPFPEGIGFFDDEPAEKVTGIAALERFHDSLVKSHWISEQGARDVALFIARCRKSTGLTVKIDDPCYGRPETRPCSFDDLVWNGDELLDPINQNPMDDSAIMAIEYASRSAKLTLHLDEGEIITFAVTGLAGAKPKPIKVPAPKSDVQGLAAIGANIAFLSDGVSKNLRRSYRDDEDYIIVEEARSDMRTLRAFKTAMTTGYVAVNDTGPIAFNDAVQWHKNRLYVMGKRIYPEVGNIALDPVTQTLTIYEADKDRETTIQIVAGLDLPLAA